MSFRRSATAIAAVLTLSTAGAQAHVPEGTYHTGAGPAAPAKGEARPARKVAAKRAASSPAARPAPIPVVSQPVAAPASPRVAALPSEAEIAVLFDLWNAALQTGNAELVASLYASDGVLLPTVSNRVRTNRAQIADYFLHFLELQPRGTINQQHIRILSPDLALNAGVYTFDLLRDGKPEQVTARYDFLYKRVNGRWLIVDHHSSKMPESPAAGTAPAALQTASAGH